MCHRRKTQLWGRILCYASVLCEFSMASEYNSCLKEHAGSPAAFVLPDSFWSLVTSEEDHCHGSIQTPWTDRPRWLAF